MRYRFFTRIFIPILSLFAATILHHFLYMQHSNVPDYVLLIGVVALCFGIPQLIIYILEKNISVVFKITHLNTANKIKDNAHPGLVVFLSLYSLTKEGITKWKGIHGYYPDDNHEQFKSDVNQLNKEKNYKGLLIDDLHATNFGNTTRAILTHRDKLRVLWIITTESKNNTNSASRDFIETYERYLQEEINKEKDICVNTHYTISIDDDPKVVEETSEILKDIYKNAKKHRLKPKEVVVDVTAGTVSMTTGAVLGSIGREKDVQLLVAGHEPGHGLVRMRDPVIIKYETVLPRESE